MTVALCVVAINLAGFALSCLIGGKVGRELGRREGFDAGLSEVRSGRAVSDALFQEAEEKTLESDYPDTAITPMVGAPS